MQPDEPEDPAPAPDAIAVLSPRQREVLELMAAGRSNVAIRDALVLSDRTVETHVRSIYERLGLEPAPDSHRRVLAAVRFLDAQSRRRNAGTAALATAA